MPLEIRTSEPPEVAWLSSAEHDELLRRVPEARNFSWLQGFHDYETGPYGRDRVVCWPWRLDQPAEHLVLTSPGHPC